MKDIQKYTDKNISDQDLERITQKLLTAKFDQEQKKKWQATLRDQYNIQRPKNSEHKLRKWVRPLQIAAAILLVISAYLTYHWLQSPDYLQLTDQYLLEEQQTQLMLRNLPAETTTQAAELRLKAQDAFDKKQFEDAILYREELARTSDPSLEDRYFLGLCYLNTNQPEQAIQQFTRAQEDHAESSRFSEAIRWYLSLALIKAEQFKPARQTLQIIIIDKSWQYQKAQNLLKKLPK